MAFMWLRILYLLKTVYNFSIYSDAYAKRLCALYGFENDIWFTIKTQFVVHPERSILFIFLAFTSMFAYIVRIFELYVKNLLSSNYKSPSSRKSKVKIYNFAKAKWQSLSKTSKNTIVDRWGFDFQ